ncbi:Guanylyl cyclase [Radiomyces spectabilis]|uniref:Guanylyl cyclase n=1 Tax=Radiomyces spectabilis TaxID=64574 RepID=UPI00221EC628|nr:Guanylyl cyclase [Radiomyces spectabilis]KAI8368193.1 Guanylyl cyclase [Radiomyces spectabilis]
MPSLGHDDHRRTTAEDAIMNYGDFNDHCVPHIMQNTYWDCGLASLAMVLRGLGVNCGVDDLAKQCPVKSIWTIDLAFLLRNYVQDFTYYTSYLGSRKEYQDAKFYQDDFDEDEKRVNKLFAIAKSCSVHVVRMVLPLDDFKRFLHCRRFVIVALINARLLDCQLCRTRQGCLASMCGHLDLVLERFKGYDYLGHFIVLIGYDPTTDVFIYRDPAKPDEFCTASAELIDRARQSEGTDHDCIVVKLP